MIFKIAQPKTFQPKTAKTAYLSQLSINPTKKFKGFCILLLSFSFFSCVSTQAPQKSNLTTGVVKTQIHKGHTSQAEIVKLIGSPNIITKNKEGDEVWTYSRQSFDSESGGFAGGLLLFGGGKAFSSASSNSFDLIITFDKKSIVKDYSLISSQF